MVEWSPQEYVVLMMMSDEDAGMTQPLAGTVVVVMDPSWPGPVVVTTTDGCVTWWACHAVKSWTDGGVREACQGCPAGGVAA